MIQQLVVNFLFDDVFFSTLVTVFPHSHSSLALSSPHQPPPPSLLSSLRYRIPGSTLSLLQQSNADVFLSLLLLLAAALGSVMIALAALVPFIRSKTKSKKD